jgi:hypothetical protein
MNSLTPVDPAVKRAQMAAGPLYLALVAKLNDPRTQVPFEFASGPMPEAEVARFNDLLQAAPGEEKYKVTYAHEIRTKVDLFQHDEHFLIVDFAPRPQ